MDKCKDCGNELRVCGSRYEIKNDDAPDKVTELFVVIVLECVNPQCVNYGKKFEVARKQQICTSKKI